MDGGDGRHSLTDQAPHQVQRLELVLHVQVRRRLVQEQDLRLLRQGPGEKDTLALSAGEAGHGALDKRVGLGQAHRLDGEPALGGALHLKPAHVGIAAHHYHFQRRESEGVRRQLRQHGQDLGNVAGRHFTQVGPFEPHRSFLLLQQPRDRLEQRRFARAVGADEADELAPARSDGDAVDDAGPIDLIDQVSGSERQWRVLPCTAGIPCRRRALPGHSGKLNGPNSFPAKSSGQRIFARSSDPRRFQNDSVVYRIPDTR